MNDISLHEEKTQEEQDIQNDYEYSRDTYKKLVDTGLDSLEGLKDLADELDDPKGYEALARTITSISNTMDKLMILQKAKKDIEKVDEPKPASGDTIPSPGNTHIFFGTTTEFQRELINQQNAGKNKLLTEDGDIIKE